jgi:hypothetical protein
MMIYTISLPLYKCAKLFRSLPRTIENRRDCDVCSKHESENKASAKAIQIVSDKSTEIISITKPSILNSNRFLDFVKYTKEAPNSP